MVVALDYEGPRIKVVFHRKKSGLHHNLFGWFRYDRLTAGRWDSPVSLLHNLPWCGKLL
jgi:hypothetical protein